MAVFCCWGIWTLRSLGALGGWGEYTSRLWKSRVLMAWAGVGGWWLCEGRIGCGTAFQEVGKQWLEGVLGGVVEWAARRTRTSIRDVDEHGDKRLSGEGICVLCIKRKRSILLIIGDANEVYNANRLKERLDDRYPCEARYGILIPLEQMHTLSKLREVRQENLMTKNIEAKARINKKAPQSVETVDQRAANL